MSRIVSGVVILRSNQESPSQSYNARQQDDIKEACARKTEALVEAMMFVPGVTSKSSGGVKQASMLMKAMEMSPSGDSTPGKGLTPPSIRSAWNLLLTSRSLMLDKAILLKLLIPSCTQPHTGPGGHMGLFDCLVYALQTKSSSANSPLAKNGASAMSSPPPHITLPDIIIFFAVCKKYWDLQRQIHINVIQSFSGDDPAIKSMSRLMFLIYDGYQKNSVISRDTIQRFMSDVYGDESVKKPQTKDVLTKMFYNPNTPLTAREFRDGIADTMSYSPMPSHFLLDWMAVLAQAIMPKRLTKSRDKPSNIDEKDEGSTIGSNLPESAAVLLKKMDQQRRWLPQICERFHLAEYRLYEIRRRFHSLVESTTAVIQGDPMGAAVNDDVGNNNSSGSNSDNTNSRRRSSVASNTPKHYIPASVFLKKVCLPSNELGHGGYLPEEIAKRIFESVSKSSSLLGGPEEGDEDDEDDEDIDVNASYWDLCHVLQFGGMCLRSKDNDETMVKWIMNLFCRRGAKILNRVELEALLVCLCSHADFRRLADRPKWDRFEDSDDDEDQDDNDNSAEVMVSLSSALNLELLPTSFGGKSNDSQKVPVRKLVDHFFETIKSTNDTVSEEEFLSWHLGTTQYSKQRLGPLMLDIRLIASVMFGVPPKPASLEHLLVQEIQERHMKRFPQTDVSRRGPRGTVWYLVDDKWYKSWTEMVEVVKNTKDDGEDLRDKSSTSTSPRRLGQINNTKLLRENGSLALRVDIKWRQDYEILPPLAWSALQAWYDGGPPISRTVVPYYSGSSNSSVGPNRGRAISLRTDNEIELYPFFVTMFLCDTTSRGEARPFQQAVPVSRVNPIRVLLVQLCKELDIDPEMGRLWVIERTTDPDQNGKNDWLLDIDSNIVEQRKKRIGTDQNGKSTINLLLELKNKDTNEWPRGLSGKNWPSQKEDEGDMETGDGIVGLFNMGNTCYLNSSIQCLSHTPIFRDYFTSKCYLNDINTTNPLGHEGRLAQVYAVLISNIWKRFNQQALHKPKRVTAPGSYAPVNAPALTPKTFKESIGKFNEHFAGNEQHDAQELLAFLLGGLSEDLNRIQNKPYIEAPDSDGRPDSELADIWWSNHLKRETSIVVAMFTGQYKSLLRCKCCKYESARFEPFSVLQLPLPEDDTVPVSLIFYSSDPTMGITKYSVRVHNNGTLYDVLVALAKVIHSDRQASKGEAHDESGKSVDPENSKNEEAMAKLKSTYAKLAQNMAVVDMREGYIFKIAPNVWRLPDLQNKDTGELPLLHVYGLDAFPDDAKTKNLKDGNIDEKDDEVDDEESEDATPKYSFLALAQRRSDLLSKDLIHPFSQRVFGTPLLLRVRDLDGLTGSQLYDIVAKHLYHVVPQGAHKFLMNGNDSTLDCKVDRNDTDGTKKTKKEIRDSLEKTTSDTEEVSAGLIPRYGFRLRLASREGRRCSICPWYECCIGCLVPDDGDLTVVDNGDSLAIDWHFAVDIATAGFGTRANQADNSSHGKGTTSRSRAPGVEIKNHYSCGVGLKKGQADAITLEDCLDAFAEEEKIPEAYCSKCKDFQVQTKRMSLWRLPPVVIIQLKRFQFTQHMRRKLRDFVQFPVEGLDLSRIMATDGAKNPRKTTDSNVEKDISDKDSVEADEADSGSASSQMNGDNGRGEKLYDLYGVVHHQGALSGGHYVASLKSDIDGQWRLFNDAQVYEIHSRDVVDSSAYILFYIRRDVANQKLSDFWDVRKRAGEGFTEEEMNELIKGQSDKCVIS